MSLISFKISAALLILVISLLAGCWPFFKKLQTDVHAPEHFDFPLAEFFASGVFLGAGILHLLPDATKAFAAAGYHYPFAFLIAAAGFLLFLSIEQIHLFLHSNSKSLAISLAIVTTIMLSFHAFLEGTAVGVAPTFATSFIIFLAILFHKGAESFSLALHLQRSSLRFLSTCFLFGFFLLMTPLGILIGNWLNLSGEHDILAAILSSLTAGTFLYIGTLHGLEHASLIRHRGNLPAFIALLLGFSLMATVAIWS